MAFSLSSRGRLTDYDLGRFPDDTLFHRLARAVCHAGCLPRKELFEAWETARRVRRLFRGGRIVDVAGGHGLLAHAMLFLDDSSADAIVVDTSLPPSSARLQASLTEAWPRLSGRVDVPDRASGGSGPASERHRRLRACVWRPQRCRPRSRGVRACPRRRLTVLPRSGRER